MKRSMWVRLIAVILIISMLAVPVSAAATDGPSDQSYGLVGVIIDLIRDIVRGIFGNWFGIPDVPTIPSISPATPELNNPTEPGAAEPVENEPARSEEQTPEYELNQTPGTEAETESVQPGKTPVTMGNVSMGLNALGTVSDNGLDLGLQVIARYSTNRLVWNAQNGVSYTVQRSSDNATWTDLTTVTTGGYLDTTAGKNTQYYYRVSTANGSTAGVRGLETGLEALMATATVAKNYGNEGLTIVNGKNENGEIVVFAEGADVTALNSLVSGTIIFRAEADTITWDAQAVMGTDSGNYAGIGNNTFRHVLGAGLAGNIRNTSLTANTDFTAVTSYEYSTNKWRIDFTNANTDFEQTLTSKFSLLGNSGASTYYIGTASANATSSNFNGTVYYVLVTPEIMSSAEINLLVEDNKAIANTPVQPEEPGRTGTQVVYFPVTMYDYDGAKINAATDAADPDGTTIREGFYFSNGGSEMTYETENTYDLSTFVAGEYYIQNVRASQNNVGSWLYSFAEDTSIRGTANKADATVWTLVIEDDQYYLKSGEKYLVVGTNGDTDRLTNTKTPISITGSGSDKGVKLGQNGYYLCQWGSNDSIYYGGWSSPNDAGNVMLFYPVDSDTPLDAKNNPVLVSGYEEWNWWNKATDNNDNGDLIYTGLVRDQLVNDQIVFNVPEGGVFNDDDTVKDIYEFVGLPFVLDLKTGIYSFDSDENGVYFKDAPQSGDGPADDQMHKLVIKQGQPQPMPTGLGVGDGSTNAFFPFNNQSSYTENQVNYHFGMRADLPFAMTPNGRVKATDNESTPITFTFSGDDDVWVFIDGHLVIDLGGIHNRLDATIDFAANTITYYESNNQDDNETTGSYNDPSFATTQKLFTDKDGEGIIPMTRDAFALDGDHEMQVFYLERGKGTSNGRIEFNLPMSDTVIVTKDATQSWSQAAEDRDNAKNNDDDPNNNVHEDLLGIDKLTDAEQAAVNNINFGFTLYKKTAEEGAQFVPVANTNFYLIGRGVVGNVINSTDANGHFYLKNGQSAKFITELPTEGVTYYVVEDQVPDGFISPDFKFAGEAAYNYTYFNGDDIKTVGTDASKIPEQIIDMPKYNEETKEWYDWAVNKSYEVTVKGSIEVQDSIEFKCINFFDATLPNPTAIANEDIIVIDYGLPVQIDPMANDIVRSDVVRIVYWGDENLTLEGYLEAVAATKDGSMLPAPKSELDFGTVQKHDGVATGETATRDTFTYTLNKQLTEVEVISYIIEASSTDTQDATGNTTTVSEYSLGKIYIVPATVMYYEENFSDLVTFTGKGWYVPETLDQDDPEMRVETTTGHSDYQEPGVVGTTTDSIYGSDVAYLNDSFDSNGTSYFGDTTNGAIRFTYTFTGTGTSIFARTSAETGYMQVKIYAGDSATGDPIDIFYRDTYWEDKNGSELDGDTLYNIPVYTDEDLPYGTYTMVCTVAKKGTQGAGKTQPLKKTITHECYDENGEPIYIFYDDEGVEHIYEYSENDERIEVTNREHKICHDQKGRELEAQQSGGEFYLDGIRIMQPLNRDSSEALVEKALGAYAADGESNLDTVTLRYKLITDNETGDNEWNFAVLTDTNGSVVTAEDYITIGPKEEVYLLPGQSVSFAVKYWHPDGYRMHMGMKAPFGTATVQVGQNTIDLNNAADCYYDISGMHASVVSKTDENGQEYYVATYTFTATESIVSLTNIKVVGNYKFTLIENTDINQ